MVAIVVPYVIVVTLLAVFIIATILVNHNVIFKYTDNCVKRFFAHPLLMYSIRRMASAVISLLLAITATFFLLRLESPKVLYCGSRFNKFGPEIAAILCEAKISRLGLDQPIILQLFRYLYNVLPIPKQICTSEIVSSSGFSCMPMNLKWTVINLGTSTVLADGKQITTIFGETMPWSLWIGLGGMIIETIIGYPLGVFMAKYKNKLVDKLGNTYIILVGAIPGLVYYYLLQALFVQVLRLPMIWDKDNVISWLPAMFTLGIGGVAGIALWVRRYMVDEFGADYVKFARAKGIPENTILFKHVLRNAVVPLVRTLPTGILYCLLGSYFIEAIYNVEGFGKLLITSINSKDYPLVQAVVVISALISIVANLFGDIATAIADPRVSLTSKQ